MARHLSLDDRSAIRNGLDRGDSFKQIGRDLGKDCTTISREVRSHMVFRKTGAMGKAYNACVHRQECDRRCLCKGCTKNRFCWSCKDCNHACPDFEQEHCQRLKKPPYVCNGCPDRNRCTLEKCLYDPVIAHNEYRAVLSEAREGICLSEEDVRRLDDLVSPLVLKGQSFRHIHVNNRDSIMVSERTLYRLADYSLFRARNIDLPRKVRYARRRPKKQYKVDRGCRIGRTYQNFMDFMELNPDLPITELDSVEGTKGGKVLLTIHFVKTGLMLAFLRDYNDSQSVIDIIDRLWLELRPDRFERIMPVLLADNGSEFSNPAALESDRQGGTRTRVFYCDPSAPYEKGAAERNHELIRYVIPKGESLDGYTQADISLMMDHINSYSRKSLGDRCPYDMFEFLYGREILDLLGCRKIHPNDVTLNKSLFKGGPS